jgi:hypothetical protein
MIVSVRVVYCQGTVDPFSATSVFVLQLNHLGNPLLNASGFFFQGKNGTLFITNNHVVNGKFAQDERLRLQHKPLPADSIPVSLVVRCYSPKVGDYINLQIPLKDKNGDKTWTTYYEDDSNPATLLDIISIPVVLPKTVYEGSVLKKENIDTTLLLDNGMDLFVVGFPNDQANYSLFPIWKRGTIASEPNLETSSFLIDATTRGGMSGSPVFFRGTSYRTTRAMMMGTGLNTFLIGIYSAQNYMSELGVVTKLKKVIDKLSQ